MTDRDLMQQALEALESVTGHFTRTPSTLRDSEVRGEAHKTITALRERLTQPEQEHMSERIRELAEQCVGDRPYNSSFDYEKFAELIVRECGKYLEAEAERLYALSAQESNPNFQSNFEICAEKCYDNIQGLKEHFGVEE